MKRAALLIILLAFNCSYTSVNGSKSRADVYPEICSSGELIKLAKTELKPDYIYDGFKSIKIKLKDKAQVKRMLFPVNSSVEFKYVFSRSALPDGAEIRIYNSKTPSEKSLKFRSEFDGDQDVLSFETTKDMWAALIELKIPAAEEGIDAGCVCVLAGYKL